MSQDLLILFAAGMLVTAYLMVGQKALFTAIRLYALQSMLLGGVAVLMAVTEDRPHLLASAALTVALKGMLIPWFLMRVIDRVGIHREVEPILNVPSSLLICLGLTVIGYRVSTGLVEGTGSAAHHVIGVSLSMLLMGLFLMVTRRKAVTQILALLTVENAVFLVALGAATRGMPLVVELGISFDVLVAVLVLGVLVRRIVDRFESMDVSRLSKLKG
ncbi:MAG TPA: hydrogenase [Vicinamibacteria bacterium]|nr:hydrogenase [Vicinamibacteria bacterium]